MTTQLAEQLLKIRQRNLLALADARKGNGPLMLTHREVNHGGNCKTAFGG
jgi:hypothetical protein